MSQQPYIKQVRHPMDWAQILTIIGAVVGVWYAFYNITDKRIDIMEQHHREDIQKMDAKLDKMDEKLEKMDAKWEHLFERLLLQDKQSKG